jgi:hypothetical protein
MEPREPLQRFLPRAGLCVTRGRHDLLAERRCLAVCWCGRGCPSAPVGSIRWKGKCSAPRNRPRRSTGLCDVEDPTVSTQSARRWR